MTAGGPIDGKGVDGKGAPLWLSNSQYQISLLEASRCFVFLEMLNVKTDMRDVEGLQTEPDYPTCGFVVCKGRGNHVKLDTSQPLQTLFTAPLKRGDGVYLELGPLEADEDRYVVIPYTDKPGVEHSFCLTLYSDYEHDFIKIDPRLNCAVCGNPSGIFRVIDTLDRMMKLTRRVHNKEHRLSIGDDCTNEDFFANAPPQPMNMPLAPMNLSLVPMAGQLPYGGGVGVGAAIVEEGATADDRKFLAADTDGDGLVSAEEAADYLAYHAAADTDGDGRVDLKELMRFLRPVEEQNEAEAREQTAALSELEQQHNAMQAQLDGVRRELAALGVSEAEIAEHVSRAKKGSAMCSVM